MASQSAEEKLVYVFTVLKNTALAQPDYKAVATEAGINNANNAQKKFKAIIESAGFKLNKQQIESADGSTGSKNGGNGAATASTRPQSKKTAAPSTTKKTPAKKAAAQKPNGAVVKGKKRKYEDTIDFESESDGGDDLVEDVQVKPENEVNEENESDGSDLEVMGTGRSRSVTVKAE